MESYHHLDNSDAHLPPGFRFHPTDEELITYYLIKKVLDSNFTGRAIAEVDLNKCEPWELPGWYTFSLVFLTNLQILLIFYFLVHPNRKGKDGREGVVLLQPPRPEVSDRPPNEPGHGSWILEGDWKGQRDLQFEDVFTCGDEEDAGFLQGESSEGGEEQLGHA